MTKRVSVFVCGVQKAGTTSLHAYMQEHAQLSAPLQKELHFFDDEGRDWGNVNYRDLHACFAQDDGSRLRFEATPIYSFWPPSIARIHAYNPDARLILLFRDPYERALSHWQMEYARGLESLPFATAIRDGRRRLCGLPPLAPEYRVYTYIERGRYAEQVSRVLKYFKRHQVLFVRSEDLSTNRTDTLRRISAFLGVLDFPPIAAKYLNRRPDIFRGFSPDLDDVKYVSTLLKEELVAFSDLTGLDVTDWPTMTGKIKQ
jgi:hypothetical protein